MKRVMIYFLTFLVITITSCSKSKDNNLGSTHLVFPDYGYIPFYPGNYWIYEHYKIDTLGNESLLDVYDSLVITGITSVLLKPYFVFEGTWMSGPDITDTTLLLRDSAGYYIDPEGWIHFASNNFTDTLASFTNSANGDTLYQSWYKMEYEPQEVSVPAGIFTTVNYQGTIVTHIPAPGVQKIRYKDRLYAKNIGQVLDTYFFLGSPLRFERRLKRYFVDKRSNSY